MDNPISETTSQNNHTNTKPPFRQKSFPTKVVIIAISLLAASGIFIVCAQIILAVQIGPPERSDSPDLQIVEDEEYDVESALLMIDLLCHQGDYFACLDAGTIYESGHFQDLSFSPDIHKAVEKYQRACQIESNEERSTPKTGCQAVQRLRSTQ